ncbi:hypothetical protein [Cesiribacter andamanensis]|uniref:Uncharacterized protein n=1 Tax=Cesiribacter andamanensis AMV16 TaxID=1279009 RepID=M7N2C7_9BACT|nr:hypothetical protein [Cesiribacter andamanensis]EMR01462.1 hypothetical protein ADICEAN_03418 [Cesiribacter andamanensis AMV16]
MEQHQNRGRLEDFLADLGRKLDQLLDRARHETEEGKIAERLDELRHSKEKLEKELHEFVQDDERWKEVQHRLQGAAQELKRAFEITFARRKGTENSGSAESSSGFGSQPHAPSSAPGSSGHPDTGSTTGGGGAPGTGGTAGAGGDTSIY